MGEIADEMINGESCALCGCYFENPDKPGTIYQHGYPAACNDCWEPDCGYEKAEVETF